MSSGHSAPSPSAFTSAYAQTVLPRQALPLEAHLLCGIDPVYLPTGGSSDEHERKRFESFWGFLKSLYANLIELSNARLNGRPFAPLPAVDSQARDALQAVLGPRVDSFLQWLNDLHFRLLGVVPVLVAYKPLVLPPIPSSEAQGTKVPAGQGPKPTVKTQTPLASNGQSSLTKAQTPLALKGPGPSMKAQGTAAPKEQSPAPRPAGSTSTQDGWSIVARRGHLTQPLSPSLAGRADMPNLSRYPTSKQPLPITRGFKQGKQWTAADLSSTDCAEIRKLWNQLARRNPYWDPYHEHITAAQAVELLSKAPQILDRYTPKGHKSFDSHLGNRARPDTTAPATTAAATKAAATKAAATTAAPAARVFVPPPPPDGSVVVSDEDAAIFEAEDIRERVRLNGLLDADDDSDSHWFGN
jgi:hypothetical protein